MNDLRNALFVLIQLQVTIYFNSILFSKIVTIAVGSRATSTSQGTCTILRGTSSCFKSVSSLSYFLFFPFKFHFILLSSSKDMNRIPVIHGTLKNRGTLNSSSAQNEFWIFPCFSFLLFFLSSPTWLLLWLWLRWLRWLLWEVAFVQSKIFQPPLLWLWNNWRNALHVFEDFLRSHTMPAFSTNRSHYCVSKFTPAIDGWHLLPNWC